MAELEGSKSILEGNAKAHQGDALGDTEFSDSDTDDMVFLEEEAVADFPNMTEGDRGDIDQDEFFLRSLLKWPSDYIYTEKGLEDERILMVIQTEAYVEIYIITKSSSYVNVEESS